MSMKFKDTIDGSISKNATTATKLETKRTINGTNFDGSANITTTNWGTARKIYIADSSSTNKGTAISVNGSGDVTLKLPATIKASLTGNASTASSAAKLTTGRTISITGVANGSATFDGSSNITIATNPTIFSSGGTAGTQGYIEFARMTITGNYTNRPIEFTLISRGRPTSCTVSIAFSNTDSSDPGLSSIKYTGSDYGVFIQKTATSTWAVYATKSEAYDTIYLVGKNYANQPITITHPGTFITTKPTENITNATLGGTINNSVFADKLTTARTITIGNKSNNFDGSANISYTLSEIGAAASGHTHDDRYYTESEINKKVTSLQAEIDADVKVEADRAKAAENALQANIDKKANSSHGNHVPEKQTANNKVFLRNDNTWQTVTPANIGAASSSHTHDDRYYTETEINSKITTINTAISNAQTAAQKYADNKITALVDSAPDAMNTLNELAEAISDHQDVYDAYVEEVTGKLAGKSDTGHTHNYAGSSSAGGAATSANKVNTNLTIKLNGGKTEGTNLFTFNGSAAKTIDITPSSIGAAKASHGTHVNYATATPKANGTAAIGSSEKVAREDHVHPLQTSVSGNAGTATALQTARTLTIGNTGKAFDGTGNVSWSLSEIGAAKASHGLHFISKTIATGFDTAYRTQTKGNTSQGDYLATIRNDTANIANAPQYGSGLAWGRGDTHGYLYTNYNTAQLYVGGGNENKLNWVKQVSFTDHNHDSKYATASHGTHVTYSTTTPKANGTAAVGSEGTVARGDHVHPLQTSISGNAGTATKLQTARSINGTSFDGSGNITTANWGSSRNISISDSDGTNTGKAVSVNGSANTTLKLPATIKASLSGNAATATSAGKWTTARTLTIGNKGQSVNGSGNVSWSLADIGAAETVAWNASIKCATWSRLFQFSSSNTTAGGSFLVNIRATRASVVYNPTLLVNFSHASKCIITQINNTNYSNIQVRGVVDNNGAGYFEMYDNVNSATNSTTQAVTVSVTKLDINTTITKYTAFTTGATIPTNYTEQGKITTVSGSHYSGNAASATKLQTTRTINGTNFNGSANITTANWGTARNITIGGTSKSVNGSANVGWTLAEIGAAPTAHNHTFIESVDTRSTNPDPNTYTSRGITPEFKSASGIGLPNVGKNFAGVLTYQQWSDTSSWSGGKTTQFATIDDGRMYYRKGDGSGWGSWYQFYTTQNKPTPADIGAAKASHGDHVTYATAAPKANGTAAIGSVNRVAREDHVHPLQTSVSGNAGTATKLQNARNITIGNKTNSFNGSANISYTLADIGAAEAKHSHNENTLTRTLVTKKASSNTLTLGTERYQLADGLSNGGTINLPASPALLTEINLIINNVSLTTLKLPDTCKWRVDHNLEVGKYFMITFLYVATNVWLAEIKVYS